jgi:predicted metal-dependent phosphotriesterase family hydrolase
MGDNKKTEEKSRRWFLSLFTAADKKEAKPGMVKMLTADGKLVEIDKAVLDAASKKQKSTNKEIYNWMNNPSKENHS